MRGLRESIKPFMMVKFDPQKHRRRSIRLKGYDYSQAGAYYVTIVTYQRDCLFGEIVNKEMTLNDFGKSQMNVGAPFPIIFLLWNWARM